MSSRAGAGAGLVVLLLLATLALPLAASDHAYSHRYVLYGRVIDAAGNPVPQVNVVLGFRDLPNVEGNCGAQPNTETEAFGPTETRRTTNAYGEFMFCTHVHSMSRALPGAAILRVDEHNFTQEVELDPYFRVSFVALKLDQTVPTAEPGLLDQTHTVIARFWTEDTQTHVENIRVFGKTIDNTPVNVTLEIDGKTTTLNSTTNNYGDVALRFPVTGRPASGKVTVEALGQSFTQDIDAASGTTLVKAEMEAPSSGGISRNVLWAVVGILAAVGIVAAAVVGFRRAAARREVDALRAGTQRKRANK